MGRIVQHDPELIKSITGTIFDMASYDILTCELLERC